MRTIARTTRRAAVVLLAGMIMVPVTSTIALADPGKGNSKARSSSGANSDCGEYCSTRDGSPSRNGNGDGEAKGRPCAGCVGKADDKNPPGQYPNGSDANNGYECDGNSGVGKTNPAHTGCTTQPAPAPIVAPAPEVVEEPAQEAPVVVTQPSVQGNALTGPVVGSTGAKAPAETPDAVLGDTISTNVLGARIVRSAARPDVAGSTGGLPLTGGATTELLLAAIARLGVGAVAVRAGSARA